MVLLLRKLYLYFTKDPEGVHHFPGGGGVHHFSGGGPNANFYRNPYTYLLFSMDGVRTPYPPLDPHMGNVIITGNIYHSPASGIDLSGLMTGEVFQMMHWYCARLTPSRNTDLGSDSFCNSAFFSSPKYPLL